MHRDASLCCQRLWNFRFFLLFWFSLLYQLVREVVNIGNLFVIAICQTGTFTVWFFFATGCLYHYLFDLTTRWYGVRLGVDRAVFHLVADISRDSTYVIIALRLRIKICSIGIPFMFFFHSELFWWLKATDDFLKFFFLLLFSDFTILGETLQVFLGAGIALILLLLYYFLCLTHVYHLILIIDMFIYCCSTLFDTFVFYINQWLIKQ